MFFSFLFVPVKSYTPAERREEFPFFLPALSRMHGTDAQGIQVKEGP